MSALKPCQMWPSVILRFLFSLHLLVFAKSLTLDNAGSEFIVGFMPNLSPNIIELHLTGDSETTVDIEYPVGTTIDTAAVSPGNITIVSLPTDASEAWPDGLVASNLVRTSSTDAQEFIMYMVNRRSASSDAALALPVDVLNTEYIVADYDPLIGFGFVYETQVLVYAPFDNTTVTITPNDGMLPITVELNRGEGYLQTSADTQTGSIVSSDRPVGVTNGNFCTNVPQGILACDHIFEVSQPVQTWGKQEEL